MKTQHDNRAQQGFTLIELSIVLVIIGLIVGGILVGQDLIRAAEIRATLSQVEKYSTAVNTFRNKYGYVPGDLPATSATALGFFAETTLGGTVGHQDGNSLLEGGSAGAVVGLGETLGFWRHLTDAQMIDGNYGTSTAGTLGVLVVTTGAVTGALTAGTINQNFPPAKIGRGNYIAVYATTGFNYFQIAGMTAMTTGGVFTLTNALTPIEAQNIDAKTDDGLPLNGNARAMRHAANLNTASAAGDACSVGATVTTYDVGTTNGSTPNCQLRMRFN